MKIKFWGVRGSIPVPGPGTVRHGGNTSCVELQGANQECIVLDSGTGLRVFGLDLLKRGMPLPPIHLFVSHTHWDHIQGFPFFAPCYIPGTVINITGPVYVVEGISLQSAFAVQMKYEYFPVSNEQLAAQIEYRSISETTLQVGNLQVQTQFTNHPILNLGYRFSENGRTVVYTGDHEPYRNLFKETKGAEPPSKEDDALFGDVDQTVDDANLRFLNFIRGAHWLIIDCQYTPEEYRTSRRGWGHSSWDYCLQWMKEGGVERMAFTHHEPTRDDRALDEMLAAARAEAAKQGIDPQRIIMAEEGKELEV